MSGTHSSAVHVKMWNHVKKWNLRLKKYSDLFKYGELENKNRTQKVLVSF